MKLKNFLSGTRSLLKNIIRLDRFFWKDFKRYIIIIYTITVFDVIFNFVSRGSQAVIINYLTEIVTGKATSQRSIFILAFVLIVSLILPSFINIINSFYKLVGWRKIDELLTIGFLEKKSSLDLSQLENSENNSLFQRVQESLWRFRSYFFSQFEIFGNVFNITTILLTILFIKPIVSLIIIFFTIPEVLTKFSFSRRVWAIDNMHGPVKKKYQYLRGIFLQHTSIIDVKFSGNVGFFIGKLKSIIEPFLIEQYDNDKKRALKSSLTIFFSKLGIIISTFILIYSVYNKQMQIGTFVFLYGLIVSFQTSLSYFFGSLVQEYEDNLYVDDFFKVQDMRNDMPKTENPILLSGQTPRIELKNVSFTYPEKEREILHGLNLTINPGEKIAIVGVNGAGKSTLVKLLTRFYDVTGGSILIDGNELKDIELGSWWKILGYMQQDAPNYLFKVKQSIAMSDTSKKIDMKKVEKSAEMSLASEFIKDSKEGYNQQLGRIFDGGEALSGGQWQRLNLARVFYKDPQVFILDEPTSAMDAEAEAKIFETLSSLPEDKTVIFISHRFSTIRQADRICVIEDGRIAELGTHEELIAKKGLYNKLFSLQAKGYQ